MTKKKKILVQLMFAKTNLVSNKTIILYYRHHGNNCSQNFN